MTVELLAAALEREHREIDEAVDAFTVESASQEPVRQTLTRAIHALRRHIYLEEEFLFPPLYEAGFSAPVFVMLREHGQIWATLDSLERELHSGAGAGEALALGRQLAVQLQHHNLKEEKILYPEADTALAPEANAHLRDFLTSGTLPEGWICVKARA